MVKIFKKFRQLNSNINAQLVDNLTFIEDTSTGKIIGYKTKTGGAATVFPFSSGDIFYVYNNYTKRLSQMYLRDAFNNKDYLTVFGDGTVDTGTDTIKNDYVSVTGTRDIAYFYKFVITALKNITLEEYDITSGTAVFVKDINLNTNQTYTVSTTNKYMTSYLYKVK